MPLTAEQAKGLLDRGMMTQATYDKNFGSTVTPMPSQEDANKVVARQIKEQEVAAEKGKIDQMIDASRGLGIPEQDIKNKAQFAKEDVLQKERDLILAEDRAAIEKDGIKLTSDIAQNAPSVAPQDMMPSIPIMAGMDLMQQGVAMGAQAGAAKAAETAAQMQLTQKNIAEMRKQNEAKQLDEQQKLADEQAKLNTEIERVSNLKADPSRYWANKSTGDKITAGIAMFLGAFGGINTGINQAAQQIRSAIDRDIRLQENEIAGQREGVDRKRGLFSEMKSQFRDNRLAREAATAAYINDAQIKVQEIANRYESQEIKAKATQMIGQLEVQKQQAIGKYLEQVKLAQPVTKDADLSMLTEDQRERFVPGYGLAITKDSAVKAREAVSTIDSIKSNIDELLTIADTPGKIISPEQRSKASVIVPILIGQLRLPIVGPGAVSEKELELLQTIIADPTKIISLDQNNKTRLKTLRSRMDMQTKNQLKTFGLSSPEDKINFKPLD